MPVSEGVAKTDRSARYMKQLVQHFSHKIETELGEQTGVIRFGWGTAELTAGPEALLAKATAEDAENVARLQKVVADHAERFGAKDELTFEWGPIG